MWIGDPLWKAIDLAPYLFLGRLFEPSDNSLVIVLEEAIANKVREQSVTTLPGGITLPGPSTPIEMVPGCRIFTMSWKRYISYCVTEEMLGSTSRYDDEIYTGRLIRVYSSSHFLDFVTRDTGAPHFEPYTHIKIACQSHIIDVVATGEPEISVEVLT